MVGCRNDPRPNSLAALKAQNPCGGTMSVIDFVTMSAPAHNAARRDYRNEAGQEHADCSSESTKAERSVLLAPRWAKLYRAPSSPNCRNQAITRFEELAGAGH
jgi:hypothetical protein